MQENTLFVNEGSGKNSPEHRIQWLDIMKGIGIICVMVGHIAHTGALAGWLYTFHVPIFFFVGGCLYKKAEILSAIKHRFYTIIIPYFTLGTAVLIYYMLIEQRFREVNVTLPQAVVGLFCGSYSGLEFHSHLWFLPAYFVLTLFYNILKRLPSVAVYAVCAGLSAVYVIIPLPELPWGIDRICKYIFFYALGNLLSESGALSRLCELHPAVKLAAGAVFLAASLLLFNFGLVFGVMWFVCACMGIFAVMFISMSVERFAPLGYIGRISLVVLCVHGPIYRVVIKLLSMALCCGTEQIRTSFPTVLAVIVVTLALCCGIYELLSRVCPWIIGRKPSRGKE